MVRCANFILFTSNSITKATQHGDTVKDQTWCFIPKKRKIIFSVAEITNIKREFGLNTNLLVQEQYYSSLLKTGMNNLYLLWWEISFGFIVIAKYRIRSHLGALLANIQRVLKVSKLLKFARYEHFQNVWIVEVNLLTS